MVPLCAQFNGDYVIKWMEIFTQLCCGYAIFMSRKNIDFSHNLVNMCSMQPSILYQEYRIAIHELHTKFELFTEVGTNSDFDILIIKHHLFFLFFQIRTKKGGGCKPYSHFFLIYISAHNYPLLCSRKLIFFSKCCSFKEFSDGIFTFCNQLKLILKP